MKRCWRVAITVAAVLAGMLVMLVAPQAASASQVGDSAANVALGELGPGHSEVNIENPMNSGCNKYTGALYGQSGGCASGFGNKGDYGFAWCADFATWVWRQAGANTAGLNSGAASFYSYGVHNGTWHPAGSGYTPQPGDAVVYGLNGSGSWAAHVGIVASSSGPGVVQGNFGGDNHWGVQWDGDGVVYGQSISGYASPVPASGGGGGNQGHVLGSSCLPYRLGPSNGTGQIDCIPPGTTLTVDCVMNGQTVTGPYGSEATWDHTSYNSQNGYVPDAMIYTGSNDPIAGGCGGNGVTMQQGCLTMRTTPYVLAASTGCIPQASSINIDCTGHGDSQTGPYGATTLWDHTNYGGASGYVTDAFVYTGTDGAVAGPCPATVAPPQLNRASIPTAVRGRHYSARFTVINGQSPFTFSAVSSSLPAGLHLSSNGVLSGNPAKAGRRTFTIRVGDSENPSAIAQRSYTLRVYAPTKVTTTSLPRATKHVNYRKLLHASGGNGHYRWTMTSGSLPAGLSLSRSGVISGRPKRKTTHTFTVKVRDSASHSARRALTLKVK